MRPCVRRSSIGSGGFTLLEVLVAFIVAAAALAALTHGALGGLQSVRVSSHVQEATSRARSRLAAIGRGIPLQPGDQRGDDGGDFRWRLSVEPVAVADPGVLPSTEPPGDESSGADAAPRPVLYDVAITIEWHSDGNQRQVTLSTRRLGLARPDPS